MKELSKLIKESGKSTEEISLAVGVSPGTIVRYKAGHRSIPKARYDILVKFLGEEFVVNGLAPCAKKAEGAEPKSGWKRLFTKGPYKSKRAARRGKAPAVGPTEVYGKYLLKYVLVDCDEYKTVIPRYYEGKETEMVKYLTEELKLKDPSWYYDNVEEDGEVYVFGYVSVRKW